MSKVGYNLPNCTWKTRVRDDSIAGDNPYRWQDMKTNDYFGGKRVVMFSLPGAFTPTCSTMQVPGFESNAQKFYDMGIDDIVCVSVNDSFIMNKWAQTVVEGGLQHVKVIPDGNGDLTQSLNMDVLFRNRGFGMRSWRYALVADNKKITHWFEEPGRCDNSDPDPYGETSPENILAALQQ